MYYCLSRADLITSLTEELLMPRANGVIVEIIGYILAMHETQGLEELSEAKMFSYD